MTGSTGRAAAPASARAEVEVLHDRIDAGLVRLGAVLAGSPLDLALRRQGEAPTPERDLIAEYDRLLAERLRRPRGLWGSYLIGRPLPPAPPAEAAATPTADPRPR